MAQHSDSLTMTRAKEREVSARDLAHDGRKSSNQKVIVRNNKADYRVIIVNHHGTDQNERPFFEAKEGERESLKIQELCAFFYAKGGAFFN